MESREMLAKAQRGERITARYSLHAERADGCNDHRWRVILCVDDSDVVECRTCGEQRVTSCNFDDEYS